MADDATQIDIYSANGYADNFSATARAYLTGINGSSDVDPKLTSDEINQIVSDIVAAIPSVVWEDGQPTVSDQAYAEFRSAVEAAVTNNDALQKASRLQQWRGQEKPADLAIEYLTAIGNLNPVYEYAGWFEGQLQEQAKTEGSELHTYYASPEFTKWADTNFDSIDDAINYDISLRVDKQLLGVVGAKLEASTDKAHMLESQKAVHAGLEKIDQAIKAAEAQLEQVKVNLQNDSENNELQTKIDELEGSIEALKRDRGVMGAQYPPVIPTRGLGAVEIEFDDKGSIAFSAYGDADHVVDGKSSSMLSKEACSNTGFAKNPTVLDKIGQGVGAFGKTMYTMAEMGVTTKDEDTRLEVAGIFKSLGAFKDIGLPGIQQFGQILETVGTMLESYSSMMDSMTNIRRYTDRENYPTSNPLFSEDEILEVNTKRATLKDPKDLKTFDDALHALDGKIDREKDRSAVKGFLQKHVRGNSAERDQTEKWSADPVAFQACVNDLRSREGGAYGDFIKEYKEALKGDTVSQELIETQLAPFMAKESVEKNAEQSVENEEMKVDYVTDNNERLVITGFLCSLGGGEDVSIRIDSEPSEGQGVTITASSLNDLVTQATKSNDTGITSAERLQGAIEEAVAQARSMTD